MGRIIGYHGTPYTFDAEWGAPLGRFRSDRVGSGFGKQAYGHGLYNSTGFEVADTHRERTVAQTGVEWLNSTDPDRVARAALYVFGKDADQWLAQQVRNAKRPRRAIFTRARDALATSEPLRGRVYEIDIPDGGYLDWSTQLGKQDIAQRLSHLGPDTSMPGWALHDMLVSRTGGQKQAAEALRKAGVRGITYRSGSDDNFVNFNDDEISIRALRAALLALLGGSALSAERSDNYA